MKTRLFALLWLFLSVSAFASDLNKGITFSDGQRITAAQLHQLVDNATIVPGFYIGKDAESAVAGSDLFLVCITGTTPVLKKATANSVLYQNYALITGQTEKSTPVSA